MIDLSNNLRDKTLDHLSKLDASMQKIHLDRDEQEMKSLEYLRILKHFKWISLSRLLIDQSNIVHQRSSLELISTKTFPSCKLFQYRYEMRTNKTSMLFLFCTSFEVSIALFYTLEHFFSINHLLDTRARMTLNEVM